MAHKNPNHPTHPKGTKARVLLTSVFGPYAQNDAYGSRLINPMELYHNQVTRVQEAFSLRTFNRSWGLMLIQVNLQAPCTLLDFPTEERFLEEIKTNEYDVIGISSIMTNLLKVRRMCKLIRKHQPNATIIIGGHVASLSVLQKYVSADHVVRGDGVRWMRNFLCEDPEQPIRHPVVRGNIGSRIMGVSLRRHPGDDCATLIPSVGCPIGCNFCSTSAMFGGKGSLLSIITRATTCSRSCVLSSRSWGIKAFFVMDENFLIDKKRALQLLARMEENNKPWSLYVFSSANVLQKYTMEQLVALGVSWVWMGLEGKGSQYTKLAGTDTVAFTKNLRDHGIPRPRFKHHRPRRTHARKYRRSDRKRRQPQDRVPSVHALHADPRHAAVCRTRSRQLAQELGRRVDRRHSRPARFQITTIPTSKMAKRPSCCCVPSVAILKSTARASCASSAPCCKLGRNSKTIPMRESEHASLTRPRTSPYVYASVLWATRKYYQDDPVRVAEITELLQELYAECGLKSRLAAQIGGVTCTANSQARKRLDDGWTYEPPTFYETNYADGPANAERVEGIQSHPTNSSTAVDIGDDLEVHQLESVS